MRTQSIKHGGDGAPPSRAEINRPSINHLESGAPSPQDVSAAAACMERLAAPADMAAWVAAQQPGRLAVFTEDRLHAVRRQDGLPAHWLARSPAERLSFHGAARPGEFYVFQIAACACDGDIAGLTLALAPLTGGHGASLADVRCFNLGGVDPEGRLFGKTLPPLAQGRVQALWIGIDVPATAAGRFSGTYAVRAAGVAPIPVAVALDVCGEPLPDHGDREGWRLSRLRWLDSAIAQSGAIPKPFVPVKIAGRNSIRILGRRLTLSPLGLPAQVTSFFSASNTRLGRKGRDLLSGDVLFVVEAASGPVTWKTPGVTITKESPETAAWQVRAAGDGFGLNVEGRLEFDGFARYRLALTSFRDAEVNDIRLEAPYRLDAAPYLMGLGREGGRRPTSLNANHPESLHWNWFVRRMQDCLWMGDVNIGAQWRFKDANYTRPMGVHYYGFRPLNLPDSWGNGKRFRDDEGRGGVTVVQTSPETVLLRAFSGARRMQAGEVLHFDFDLHLTPFKPVDTEAQWRLRYLHRGGVGHEQRDIEEAPALGANVINIHHGSESAPFINYPIHDRSFADFVEVARQAHARGLRVKPYDTVRELTPHLPELFALHSLNGEVILPGPENNTRTLLCPHGPHPWLREHLREGYIPAWTTTLTGKHADQRFDPSVLVAPDSRWNNFYLEGLALLVKHAGIDGIYVDDTWLDRRALLRAQRIFGPAGGLIDMHTWNHFNEVARFASCANLYMELFPFIHRIWYGEAFDYNRPPDYWLTEVAGIPYGVMGEMLQDGGNPWRGMLYGMTCRLYGGAADPRPVWKIQDAFGMAGSDMLGYWDPACPVRTGRPDVLATVYRKPGRVLIALASWAPDPVRVKLRINWRRLGVARGALRAPAAPPFQPERVFQPGEAIPIEPGRGWLLIAG